MKQYFLSLFFTFTTLLVGLQQGRAFDRLDRIDRIDRAERRREMQENLKKPSVESEDENVKWVGIIKDDPSTHTEEHKHKLKFYKLDNGLYGKAYDLEVNPELVKLHHDTEKNYVIEVEAKKATKFLIWGERLNIKKFKVLREASERVPHNDLG